ncbi:MAG: TorD/DmsD family molecular chaperone [Sagittula sp.]|jgi:TorA maturation chaperone TorD|uniref:TorD/DmsD family molecular chaperone n=1 Tax=unclassified Sagittula TaxID=2624628 RepID=UPI000C2D0339|nr:MULTISPECIES: molecular chaperone TorD family protein [unclassified Sagittula]AUC56085.1 molecular chaperone TorD [Sagittula sp. P11]WHZ38029.1 molecular chaperone TorD family protein [Sagittula sp. MA-2]
MTAAPAPKIAEEDRLRADLYNFLGVILSGPPDEMLLAQTASLSGDATPLGEAISTLAKMAKVTKPRSVVTEYNKLFIGLGRGELLPYASYYMTGFLNEKPLALLRQDMTAHGLARAENVFEPEDNIASLMEMMGALIVGRFSSPASLEAQKTFFNKHIASWAGHFFSDLENAKGSVFYAPVGTIGRTFMEIEAEAFRLG